MWNDEQETMLEAIHEGTNCTLVKSGPQGPLSIPSIYDSLVDERPILEAGGGRQLVQSLNLVVPLANENFEDYVGLVFKVGDRVAIKIRSAEYVLRVNSKSLDEVSYNLTCTSIEV